MNVTEEWKQDLETYRRELDRTMPTWRFIVGARVLMLVTTATAIGAVMNMYRTGLASLRTARITETGQVISLVSDVPSNAAAWTATLVLCAVLIAILVADLALARVQGRAEGKGRAFEERLTAGGGFFTSLHSMEREVSLAFLLLRSVAATVVVGWAAIFLSLAK